MIMKKLLFVFAMMLVGTTATFAEEGDKYLGINFSTGFFGENKDGDELIHESFTNFGLGVKGQYEVREHLRLEAAVNYFFKAKEFSMWDFNLNVHYLVPLNDKCNVYPIIGPSLMTAKGYGFFEFKTKFGVNAGAGIEYKLNDEIKVNCDFKYQHFNDWGHPVLAIGFCYQL